MTPRWKQLYDSTLHLFFPHVCAGCGTDGLEGSETLCLRCTFSLPRTGFETYANNPVDKIFWGRLLTKAACSIYYFNKETRLQDLLHQLKYQGNRALGLTLGKNMGKWLIRSDLYNTIDGMVPVPLHAKREKQRGYNQAALLAEGMASVWKVPVYNDVLIRSAATDSQTKKSRVQRWQNMQHRFSCPRPEKIKGRHLLLIDDVITTGATLESCGQCLLNGGAASLRIATLAYASL